MRTRIKITLNKVLFVVAVIFLTIKCTPTEAAKNAGGLRLSVPVESPNAVHFSWTGGAADATYSIYRRMKGEANWERIKMGLTGVSGATDVPGFTLDQTYEYKIQADTP